MLQLITLQQSNESVDTALRHFSEFRHQVLPKVFFLNNTCVRFDDV